jgi:hypothetical protein
VLVLGLVHDPGPPEPPDDDAASGPSAPWPRPPWRPFAWIALFCWLLYGAGEIGGLAGYLLILLAVTIGCWRVDRWLDKQYWGGLTER